jgi:transposase-like protein
MTTPKDKRDMGPFEVITSVQRRRRKNPMGKFTNTESAEKIMYGVSKNINANWKRTPFRNFNRILDVTYILL